jgi:DNA-binding transcriptional LysR family regulator
LTKAGCRQAGALVGKSASVTQQTDDLEQHDCIQFELPSSGRPITWLFNEGNKAREILTRGGYLCSDDVLAGVTLAKHGVGLFQTYRFIVERELAEGSLVEVLQPFSGRSRPFTLLYPHSRHMPLRLRAFMNFIMDTKQAW